MTRPCVKNRHCEIRLVESKQSTKTTRESRANRLLCVNLDAIIYWNYLSIHFWVIDSTIFLKSLDLDCFDSLRESRNDEILGFDSTCKFSQWRGISQRVVIARICIADSWQSILATYESKANLGLLVNLNAKIYRFTFGSLIQLFF